MDFLLEKEIEWDKFELLIDTSIFQKDIVMLTAYNFLDKGYFIFFMEWENIKLQCKKKEKFEWDTEQIIFEFTEELLNVYLRKKIEEDNKQLRNEIINTALSSAVDSQYYVQEGQDNVDIEVEKVLEDLKNDPELNIDENYIDKLASDSKI